MLCRHFIMWSMTIQEHFVLASFGGCSLLCQHPILYAMEVKQHYVWRIFCALLTSYYVEPDNSRKGKRKVQGVPLPLGVWEGLGFVIVALPGLFSYLS